MSFRIHCPNRKCQAKLEIPRSMQGFTVRCAACGQSFFVPPVLTRSLKTTETPKLKKAG